MCRACVLQWCRHRGSIWCLCCFKQKTAYEQRLSDWRSDVCSSDRKNSYEEMLELASLGAKVLQTRSVEMAMNHRVRTQVLSSFADTPGTLVVDEDEIVEKQIVSGVTYSAYEAKITLIDRKSTRLNSSH